MAQQMEMDTVNRDPNGLNDHIRVNAIFTKSVTLTQMRSVLFFLCFSLQLQIIASHILFTSWGSLFKTYVVVS